MCLFKLIVKFQRFLVVENCFLLDAKTEIGISQILIKVVFATVFQALLKHHNALRVPAKQV